ncbi:RHS repeat-associated core domain-containing protein [Chitinophaga sancti]|uniref:RHS repeat-associated core domain-containing protein n=1 Tax=Chitinophaga sancti TaxID=1004 RepID=UPI002A762C8F|nr:RHS repeat-associated core domain-containing protein [Chitinophaga sancti]WPQ60142.1 RHS repeat-associated core domain-containing protein [Chitinophaga sancti]
MNELFLVSTGNNTGSNGIESGGYRYGFNGKENDNEVKGEGNQIDFGARIYDPRIGMFSSLDPYMNKFAWLSPYSYASNNPIRFIDENGASTGTPPGSKKYIYNKLKVDLTKMPDSHKLANGTGIKSTNTRLNGIKENAPWCWDQIRNNNPSITWSNSNKYAMDNGFSPKADAEFVRQFPAFEAFKGQTLDIHHLNQENKVGIALPQQLHRGKGFTSLWHKFGGAVSILGMMLTVYQQTYGQDPLLVGDFTDAKWHEDELMMVEAGLGQKDYQQVVRFARGNNSRTGSMRPGTVGIYYASESEMANFQFFNLSQAGPETFVVGGWNAYYQDASQASAKLNKTVTHAVIFFQQNGSKGFTPVNVIEMVKPEEMPTNKVHNTFTNKLQ